MARLRAIAHVLASEGGDRQSASANPFAASGCGFASENRARRLRHKSPEFSVPGCGCALTPPEESVRFAVVELLSNWQAQTPSSEGLAASGGNRKDGFPACCASLTFRLCFWDAASEAKLSPQNCCESGPSWLEAVSWSTVGLVSDKRVQQAESCGPRGGSRECELQ